MKEGFFARPSKKVILVVCLALVFLLVFVSTSYAAPAGSQQGVYHTVQRGEYLSLIAARYGVSMASILAANPHITNPSLIYAGTNIFIPIGYTPPAPPPPPPAVPPFPSSCRAHHYITFGQTLSGIARFYGANPFAIAQANNIFNLNRIYAGQTLCIP
jgi:LysM repeat protein